jgi:hypothetical protein
MEPKISIEMAIGRYQQIRRVHRSNVYAVALLQVGPAIPRGPSHLARCSKRSWVGYQNAWKRELYHIAADCNMKRVASGLEPLNVLAGSGNFSHNDNDDI